MTSYTKTGPFTSGAAPGIDAGFLNNVETALVGGGSIYFTTPYQLLNNVSFTSNGTQTFTATGVGGIPSGALAVLLGTTVTGATAGVSAAFFPAGSTPGQYFTNGNVEVNGSFANIFGICPLNGSGQLSIKSQNNTSSITVWLFGYII